MISPRFSVLCLVSLALASSVALLGASSIKFEIAPQPAPTALQLFIKQSGTKVLFLYDEIKDVRTNAVSGDMEPEAALNALLRDTGLTGEKTAEAKFTVIRTAAVKAGAIEGQIRDETGKPVSGARVSLNAETAAISDRGGRFVFDQVLAGPHVLTISADGVQNTRVTDVNVKAGHRLTLSSIVVPAKNPGITQLDDYIVSARKEGVLELDPYEVRSHKTRPFSDGNADIPRTVDDAQPYYIFDAGQIDRSGAGDVEGFLKQYLTMNATALTGNQLSGRSDIGNISAINLRGIGADKTLVLVNGRRMAGVSVFDADNTSALIEGQPDVNGIPLSSIDRIEVLPTSASGIYGGSAMGGVVNIILKKNYTGGEFRATYKNAFDTDAPTRRLSFNYGQSLEGGRTNLTLSGSWSEAQPMLMQDRYALFASGQARALQNAPSSALPLGALPNIISSSVLVLKAGNVSLGSTFTHVPAGTSPTTPAATLNAGLLANAGTYNLEPPPTWQFPNGIYRTMGGRVITRSLRASFQRQMLPALDLSLEYSYNENNRYGIFAPTAQFSVAASDPFNPFTRDVAITAPLNYNAPNNGFSTTRSLVGGVLVRLPWAWTGTFDYTHSSSTLETLTIWADPTAVLAPGVNGVNLLSDTLLYPHNMEAFFAPANFTGDSLLDSYAGRASGPLPLLPWGDANLTVGLEHQIKVRPDTTRDISYPAFVLRNERRDYYRREQRTSAAYAELSLPLVEEDKFPLLHSLELQLSNRIQKYEVDAGTTVKITNKTTGAVTYTGPTLNGQPYFASTEYSNYSQTLGLKYQPTRDIIVRASYSTAFLPPTPEQLIQNPLVGTAVSRADPKLGISYPMVSIGGGNPDLTPQNSESVNFGVVWQPTKGAFQDLRLNAEYYQIKQHDFIGTLTETNLLAFENFYPERVTRDPVTGRVTLLDVSSINLFLRDTAGIDLSVEYGRRTAVGTFSGRLAGTYIERLKIQYSPVFSANEAAGFHPSEAGAPRYKANASLLWARGRWSAGWSARYVHSYKQNGAVGGPSATVRATTGTTPATRAPLTTYTLPQGGDTVGSQHYHDINLGYAFGSDYAWQSHRLGRWLDGLSIQLVVQNVFDKAPPFDMYYGISGANNFYLSPYGDVLLRNFALTVGKRF
jgi:iron complex outermembrane recepter protein